MLLQAAVTYAGMFAIGRNRRSSLGKGWHMQCSIWRTKRTKSKLNVKSLCVCVSLMETVGVYCCCWLGIDSGYDVRLAENNDFVR